MSWEAVTWANKQKLKKSYEQIVLLVLANCADPNGEAFVKWPHREHWWRYLSDRTRLPKSSLFRHLNTLVALGLCDRSTLVLADGARRPTVRLNLDASFDIDCDDDRARYDGVSCRAGEAQSPSETADFQSPVGTGDDEETEAFQNDSNFNAVEGEKSGAAAQSPVGTGISAAIPRPETEPFPVLRLQKDSITNSKTPPLPPSGGERVLDPEWEEFVGAWGEPIPKLGLSRSVFERVETGKRPKLIAAVKGYRTWLGTHPPHKRPTAQSAQSFIRDEAGWEQWLCYVPDADGKVRPAAAPVNYQPASREGRALRTLYGIGRIEDLFFATVQRQGAVWWRGEIPAQALALADAPPSGQWVQLSHQQAGAWEALLQRVITVKSRRRLVAGDAAPWPWPPRVDGTISPDAGGFDPPQPAMTTDDDEALATEGGRG